MTIYFDTEHLFNACGFNGELFKQIIQDLVGLVKEINGNNINKSGAKAISFKYFEETEAEVNWFFKIAQKIVIGESNKIRSKVAMDSILKGCKTSSDVIRKRTEFYKLLRELGIQKQKTITLYEDYQLNIESKEFFTKYEDHEHDENLDAIIKCFNMINSLRKGRNNQPFERIGHLFMTGSKIKLLLGHDPILLETGFSYASHHFYIIQTLWFRLNRGLGFVGEFPASFDVVAKAQILLANHLNASVSKRFDQINNDIKNGTRSFEDIKEYYANLRAQVSKPEEIDSENITKKVNFLLSEEDLESFLHEQAVLKQKADEFDRIKADQKTQLIEEEEQKYASLQLKMEQYQKAAERKYNLLKGLFFLALMLLVLLGLGGIFVLTTSDDTPLAVVAIIISFLSVLPISKKRSVMDFLYRKSYHRFNQLKNEIEKHT